MTGIFEYHDAFETKVGTCDKDMEETLKTEQIYLTPPDKRGKQVLLARSHGSIGVKALVMAQSGEHVWKETPGGKLIARVIAHKNDDPTDVSRENLVFKS